MTPALPWRRRDPWHDPDFDPTAVQQVVESAIAVAMEAALRLPKAPRSSAPLERVSRTCFDTADVGRVKFAVADDLDLGMPAISSPTSSKIELRK